MQWCVSHIKLRNQIAYRNSFTYMNVDHRVHSMITTTELETTLSC